MSQINKCDRCGDVFEKGGWRVMVGEVINSQFAITSEVVNSQVDICPKCHESYKAWMKGDPKPAVTPSAISNTVTVSLANTIHRDMERNGPLQDAIISVVQRAIARNRLKIYAT
jgi:hypothetical protein